MSFIQSLSSSPLVHSHTVFPSRDPKPSPFDSLDICKSVRSSIHPSIYLSSRCSSPFAISCAKPLSFLACIDWSRNNSHFYFQHHQFLAPQQRNGKLTGLEVFVVEWSWGRLVSVCLPDALMFPVHTDDVLDKVRERDAKFRINHEYSEVSNADRMLRLKNRIQQKHSLWLAISKLST